MAEKTKSEKQEASRERVQRALDNLPRTYSGDRADRKNLWAALDEVIAAATEAASVMDV